mmetsp:Transcript_14918/g.22357  ORF Transcript_14918/g.22357 Transcript_14918/m.22357 type:complete len:85 (+) Transcript_14918:235-489(+)
MGYRYIMLLSLSPFNNHMPAQSQEVQKMSLILPINNELLSRSITKNKIYYFSVLESRLSILSPSYKIASSSNMNCLRLCEFPVP